MTRSPLLNLAVSVLLSTTVVNAEDAKPLKLHNIFSSHMVIQRDKPIKIWGWAKPGEKVTVKLGGEAAETTARDAAPVEVFGHEKDYQGLGRWEVTLPAREASTEPVTLLVTTGEEKIALEDILIGDVWVMSGQSNMALPLGKVNDRGMEAAQAHLPMLRLYSITSNEQATLQEDIRPGAITTDGWVVSSPETALQFSAIGYVFGSNVQRATQIPIGVIKNARGGASIESMVPVHKFDDHPLAKRYADHVKKKMAEFDPEAEADRIWEIEKGKAKRKKQPEPERPDPRNLRSWNVPGKSPGDMGSVHNGMFGAFKGFNIKGVLFHQGFNNTLGANCRPQRYRTLMKLMVDGWREDFHDPELPVGVIGFCAGERAQNADNFEAMSDASAPYIREAQRLGLADCGDPRNTAFIPAYDVRVPGLHPRKKREHGWRAAQWALSRIYRILGNNWQAANLVSAEPHGDVMVLTFDARVHPDDRSSIVEGFSIAGENGKFYTAHARFQAKVDQRNWNDALHYESTIVHVWSPLVGKPVAVRYGWAASPMGNLKCNGDERMPLSSFRTDTWDLPESDDPAVSAITREVNQQGKADAEARLEERKLREAELATKILERLETLSAPLEDTEKKAAK
jgi:sialate O-acetylesterase